MLISTRGRYALRVMIDLAENQGGGYIPLKEVARRQEISEKYVEGVLKILVKNGMLDGLRGKGGGYRLAKAPEEYRVSDILWLTEEELAPVACLAGGAKPCRRAPECRTLPLWQGLNKVIMDYLDHTTLADLTVCAAGGADRPD